MWKEMYLEWKADLRTGWKLFGSFVAGYVSMFIWASMNPDIFNSILNNAKVENYMAYVGGVTGAAFILGLGFLIAVMLGSILAEIGLWVAIGIFSLIKIIYHKIKTISERRTA